MNSLRKLSVTGLLAAVLVVVVGCGGDDSNSGSNNSAKLESCKQVCDKSVNCPIAFPADTCKQLCDAHSQASAACQDALKAVSDCQLKQADICADTGCDSESTAYNTACSSK
ncbi:MAG TPA: hypothetical protein VER96_39175 [Polyangiaceae bacterium]|nr:hypothetical protein [Polyangiaceae bacterium]